jgi:hypothetical protein
MSNKQTRRVYSKPNVEKPKEELIEEQIEVTEAKPIDPEVFETKLFVPEDEISTEEPSLGEPEEPTTVEQINKEIYETHQNFDAEAELTKALQTEIGSESQGVDVVEEFRKLVQTELEKPLSVDAEEELTKQSPASKLESMYILTEEQEKEGAQMIAEMVNNQIIENLKRFVPKELDPRKLETLSQHDLRHFHRTGQMPK